MARVSGEDAREWRRVRAYLNENRHALGGPAARLYPGLPRVGSTSLLCRPEWLPDRPLPLESVALRMVADAPPPAVTGKEEASAALRPVRPGRPVRSVSAVGTAGTDSGDRFETYSAAVAALAAPAVFEDRCSYRLLEADLRSPAPALRIGTATYFAGVDVKEAVAHELAAAVREGPPDCPPSLAELSLRSLVGDPCDLSRHTAVPAITTVTIRRGPSPERSQVLLHRRDPAKVAHGGGLLQVMPVGVFQPVTGSPADLRRDLDLWRCMAREFSEELLGTGEDYGQGFRYEAWPFFRRLGELRASGALAVSCLGLGVDPLSLAVDVLTAAVFEPAAFDELFAGLVAVNAEGAVERATLADAAAFARGARPMQPAGAAAVELAIRHFGDKS